MLTLAVDTTASFGSIALADARGVREEVLLHEPQGFSGVLFARIEDLLARQSVTLRDIDLFAGASGPGSFTGVRIGLAAIKGLGEVLGKPVVAVSNLAALASYGRADLRATVIDARRGEVFGALFNAAGEQVVPEQVVRFPRFLELLAGYHFEWIATSFEPFRPALTGTALENFPVTLAPAALAGTIAAMAARGPFTDAAAIEANYVRRSDAELFWQS
ncbi:MAG: tRNA (adenosine(37)-N6)-threonylcarbamoyltransferase complex dimerization subunit type 1 TsaB [Acidobacteriota bacterium]